MDGYITLLSTWDTSEKSETDFTVIKILIDFNLMLLEST